jgi:hypothetical protein
MYQLGQLFPILEGGGASDSFEVAAAPVDPSDTLLPTDSVEEFLNSYWHGVPEAAIEALTEEQLATVRDILAGPPVRAWQNAATVIGLRGDAPDVARMLEIIDQAARVPEEEIANSGFPWLEVQTNAQLALGMIYERTGNEDALNAIYSQMVRPDLTSAGKDVETIKLNDLSANAVMAFELAGEEAAVIYPEAFVQSELSELVRNGVILEEAPVGTTGLAEQLIELESSITPSDTLATALEKIDASRSVETGGDFVQRFQFTDILQGNGTGVGPNNRTQIREFYQNFTQ